MVMGRPNKGIGHVDNCDGAAMAKRRLKLILQTIDGELSVQDACKKLRIQRPRFAELRAEALQAAVEALEPGRPGRPRKYDVEQQEHEAQLSSENERLRKQLHVAEVRAAVAQILPDRTPPAKRGSIANRRERRRKRK
jgi:hypothetical protein